MTKNGGDKEHPFFTRDPGASDTAKCEIWRNNPEGPTFIGEADPTFTAAEFAEFVRTQDRVWGRRGANYAAKLRRTDGSWGASKSFRVDRDPDLPRDAPAPAGNPEGTMLTTVIGIIEASNRAFVERTRAEAKERDEQHRRDMERLAKESQASSERERAFWTATRERDREIADQSRERDQAMYAFLLKKGGSGGGEVREVLGALMMGARMRDEFGGDGPQGGMMDKLGEKLGARFLRKLGGDDEEETAAAPRKPPAANGTKPAAAAGGEEYTADEQRFIDSLETLIATADEGAVSAVLTSYVKQGRIPGGRATLKEIAEGKLDGDLGYSRELLDKLHRAAAQSYHATAPRPAAKPAPAAGAGADPK